MIQFKRIHITNFLTIGDAEVQFEQGMFLVKGENLDNQLTRSNGAGKSNLFAAVSYCLFGQTPKGKEADAVVSWVTNSNCSVIVEFELSGVLYRVERYRKHKKHKNNIFVFVNGEDKSEHTTKASQLLINSIVGIEPSMFNSIIILAQGLENRFSQLKDTARRDLIQGIRNNLVWDKAREVAKTELSTVTLEYNKRTLEISTATTVVATKKQLIRDSMAQIDQLNVRISQLGADSQIQELMESRSKVEEEEEKLNQLIEANQRKLTELDAEIERLNAQVLPLREQFTERKTRYEILNSRLTNPITRCNSCGTILSQATEEELSPMKTEHTRLFNEMNALRQQGEAINVNITGLKEQKSSLQQQSADCANRIRTIRHNIKTVTDQIHSLGNEESILLGEVKYLEGQSNKAQAEIATLCEDILVKTQEQTALQEKQQRLQQVDKIFSPKGIQAFLLTQDIEFLNSRLHLYSEYLFSAETIHLDSGLNEFGEVSKLNIQLVNNTNGRVTDYTDRSGGESRRIDLAIQLSLRDLVMSISSVNTNLLVLDEVFEGIDSEGLVHVLEMLRNVIGITYCTYVITHINDLAYDYFNGEITLLRQNDVTTLVNN